MLEGQNRIMKDHASDNLPQLTMKSSLPTDYQYDSLNNLNGEVSWNKAYDATSKMDLLAVPSSPVDELKALPAFKSTRINSTVEIK